MTRDQRLREAALLLPIVGFLLLMPPLLSIFDGQALVFGVLPILPAYIFGVWLTLIVAGALLSRRLRAPRERRGAGEPGDEPGPEA